MAGPGAFENKLRPSRESKHNHTIAFCALACRHPAGMPGSVHLRSVWRPPGQPTRACNCICVLGCKRPSGRQGPADLTTIWGQSGQPTQARNCICLLRCRHRSNQRGSKARCIRNNLALAAATKTRLELHPLVWLRAPSGEARPGAFENNLAAAGTANTNMQLHLFVCLVANAWQGGTARCI